MTDWKTVIRKIAPGADSRIITMIADHADREFARHNIRTIRRQASILAHMCVETQSFTRLEENLNYSTPERLKQVWSKRFKNVATASKYIHNPEELAIYVYGDRMGNRPGTRDGWVFRGKGLLQCTGHDNTQKLARKLGVTPEIAAAWLIDPDHALECACVLYTDILNVGPAADKGDMVLETKRVNGGKNGLSERQAAFNRAMRVLAAQSAPRGVSRSRGAEPVADAVLDNVTADDLRRAGSRTITAADQIKIGVDQIKKSVGGIITSGGVASVTLSQIKDASSQVTDTITQTTDVIENVKGHASLLQVFLNHWPVIALIVATIAAIYFAYSVWRGAMGAWQGANLVTEARVDDARTGANIGR